MKQKPRKSRDIVSSLLKKGFLETSGDHKFYTLWINGKDTGIHTKISHNNQEYSANLLNLIQKQLKLTKKNFNDLIDCPFTHEMYINCLLQDGELDKEDLI